jgi:hypothetical protein
MPKATAKSKGTGKVEKRRGKKGTSTFALGHPLFCGVSVA